MKNKLLRKSGNLRYVSSESGEIDQFICFLPGNILVAKDYFENWEENINLATDLIQSCYIISKIITQNAINIAY